MVAGIAHEINGPLGSSLTVASTLQRKAELFAAKAARGDLRRSTLSEFVDLSSMLRRNWYQISIGPPNAFNPSSK